LYVYRFGLVPLRIILGLTVAVSVQRTVYVEIHCNISTGFICVKSEVCLETVVYGCYCQLTDSKWYRLSNRATINDTEWGLPTRRLANWKRLREQ